MYLLLVCLSAVVAATSAEAATPVPVTVYYESLCPDSIRFYINQLYPTMEIANLSTNVDLTLVPYGKSNTTKLDNGTRVFTCHHGENECYGNKVHACAIDILTSKNERLNYLNCLMESMLADRNIPFPAEKCAEKLKIAEKMDIINCANFTRGDALLDEMGNKTLKLQPALTSVPTVVFNNIYHETDFKQAQTNFKGVLCKYIPSPKPKECFGTSGATELGASLILLFISFVFILIQTKEC